MSSSSSGKRAAAALATCAQILLAAGAFAAQAGAHDAARPAPARPSAACEQARQFAWFTRQLRHSDGDTEPLVPPEPAECMPKPAQADADTAAPMPAHAEAPSSLQAGSLTAY